MSSRESLKKELKEFCLNKLQAVESMLYGDGLTTNYNFAPMLKLRLTAKQNILKHLVDYETCFYFASIEEISKYIVDSTDIICGFYE